SDQAIPQKQGNDKLRADALARLTIDVTRIQTNVGNRHCSPCRRGSARDSFAKRNAKARNDCVLVVLGKDAFEVLRRFIPKHYRENFIIHELFNVLRDAVKERFTVENGRQLPADVVEKRESLCLFRKSKKKGLRDRVGFAFEGKGCEFCGLFHRPGTLWSILT